MNSYKNREIYIEGICFISPEQQSPSTFCIDLIIKAISQSTNMISSIDSHSGHMKLRKIEEHASEHKNINNVSLKNQTSTHDKRVLSKT